MILHRDFLGPQMLLHGDRVIRPAFHRGVIGHDHASDTSHHSDPGDDATARNLILIHPVGCQRGKF